MKGLLFIGASLLATSSLHAAESGSFKVTGQVRLDHISTSEDKKTGEVTTKTSEGSFKLNRVRTIFEGNLDKDISYRIKFYLDRAHDTDTGPGRAYDGIDKGLVEGKLVHKISDAFALEFGRLEINSLSVEGFYSSMDSYSATDTVIFRKPGSSNGVAGVYNVAGQLITVQLVNSPGYDGDGKGQTYKTGTDDLTASVMWNGVLMDGMIRPIVSYVNLHRRDIKTTAAAGTTPVAFTYSEVYNQGMAGVGTAIVLGDTTVELEYDSIDNPKYKLNKDIDVKGGKDHVDAETFSVRHKIIPTLLGIVKYDFDKEKADLVKSEVSKTSLAFEFRPNLNSFRYHANYEYATKKVKDPSKADVKSKKSTFLIGAAVSI